MLEGFIPPEGVSEIVVWADRDKSETGERVAKALKQRLWKQQISTRIYMPNLPIEGEKKGTDWNDMLCAFGPYGFPVKSMMSLAS